MRQTTEHLFRRVRYCVGSSVPSLCEEIRLCPGQTWLPKHCSVKVICAEASAYHWKTNGARAIHHVYSVAVFRSDVWYWSQQTTKRDDHTARAKRTSRGRIAVKTARNGQGLAEHVWKASTWAQGNGHSAIVKVWNISTAWKKTIW